MSDSDYLARINQSVDLSLKTHRRENTPQNRRNALLGVKKSVELYFPEGADRETYLRLIEDERLRLDANLVVNPTYKLQTNFRYDLDSGALVEETDGLVRQVIEVRKKLAEEFMRRAVILELEKLGYTVISPEAQDQ